MYVFMNYSTNAAIFFVAINLMLHIIFMELLLAIMIEMYVLVTELKHHAKKANLAKIAKNKKKQLQKHVSMTKFNKFLKESKKDNNELSKKDANAEDTKIN